LVVPPDVQNTTVLLNVSNANTNREIKPRADSHRIFAFPEPHQYHPVAIRT